MSDHGHAPKSSPKSSGANETDLVAGAIVGPLSLFTCLVAVLVQAIIGH